jgi:hypothetical protein
LGFIYEVLNWFGKPHNKPRESELSKVQKTEQLAQEGKNDLADNIEEEVPAIFTMAPILSAIKYFPKVKNIFVVISPDEVRNFEGCFQGYRNYLMDMRLRYLGATHVMSDHLDSFLQDYVDRQGLADGKDEDGDVWYGQVDRDSIEEKEAQFYEPGFAELQALGKLTAVMSMLEFTREMAKEVLGLEIVPRIRLLRVRVVDGAGGKTVQQGFAQHGRKQ